MAENDESKRHGQSNLRRQVRKIVKTDPAAAALSTIHTHRHRERAARESIDDLTLLSNAFGRFIDLQRAHGIPLNDRDHPGWIAIHQDPRTSV